MIKLAVFLLFFSVCAHSEVDGPPAAASEILSDSIHRVTHFGLILNYMRDQALYDVVEHYSYLQNRDKSNLNLTKKQRRDLQRYIDRYYNLVKAINYQTPVTVTCQAPAQE